MSGVHIEGRPEFGNPQHIAIVRAAERAEGSASSLGEKQWTVEITFEGIMEVDVWAKTKKEAEDIANEDFDMNECRDWDRSAFARLTESEEPQ